ncbi:MAG: hypothetical protein Q8N62_08070 [Candidatus Omnitrophota bacterium]|nr:hypothetical protein [Candidatus Omnitrophota bacterium]
MLNRKGQNTAEYAILIALIIAAAVGMQTYVKRGLQGRVKEAVNHTGTAQDVGGVNLTFTGNQYEPYYAESDTKVRSERTANEELGYRGAITRSDVKEETKVDAGGVETVLSTTSAESK